MELDFSLPWRILAATEASPPPGSAFPEPASTVESEQFAAAELAALLGRMTGRPPLAGEGSEAERMIVLHTGSPKPGGPGNAAPAFSWRAGPERVEIFGEGGAGLVRGIYDFLDALGARWVGPGSSGERLPSGLRLSLAAASRRSPEGEAAAVLILGHGAYLSRWEDYLTWAARSGYARVFVHTTVESLAFGAAPARLYEALRPGIVPLARRLGLGLELGGHLLSSFLPRKLFKSEPELFRQRPEAEDGARLRSPDANFCPSNPRALELASRGFAAFAESHPEVEVFHAWPDDLPGGGWCSCPGCAARSPAAQSLASARALAEALAAARPGASLSFLAYHDTEELAGLDLSGLPPNLELLWAPRRRCWAHGLDEELCALDAASYGAYRAAAGAWAAAGGRSPAIFEYWEDGILFKGAVPPLPRTMARDLRAYARPGDPPGPGAASVGVLLAGARAPLAPRPNQWLLPRLLRRAAEPGFEPEAAAAVELADWVGAAYGPAAAPMAAYWAALEAAWAVELELEPGDTAVDPPPTRGLDLDEPPCDWGDPWPAGLERLAARRGRCEELFDRLRAAEAALDQALEAADGEEAAPWARAVRAEAGEYGLAGSLLELDCARVAAYHERAAGQAKAAADIALLARSPYAAALRALRGLPEARSRREMGLFLYASYGLRLRAIGREAAGPLARILGRLAALAELALRAAGAYRAWERP